LTANVTATSLLAKIAENPSAPPYKSLATLEELPGALLGYGLLCFTDQQVSQLVAARGATGEDHPASIVVDSAVASALSQYATFITLGAALSIYPINSPRIWPNDSANTRLLHAFVLRAAGTTTVHVGTNLQALAEEIARSWPAPVVPDQRPQAPARALHQQAIHLEILDESQKQVLAPLSRFGSEFVMAGGTAIALLLGHRKSNELNFFSNLNFSTANISNELARAGLRPDQTLLSNANELLVSISGVKVSFQWFPFTVIGAIEVPGFMCLPSLLSLAAMKAHAIGRRDKWNDYVDLYFILRDHFTIQAVSDEAERIFGGDFNSRCFREQLAAFNFMDHSDVVEFMPGFAITDEAIEAFLTKAAIS
jgi:hypothetical protein